jgi:uncharacterized protein (TIGR00251 family)
VICIKECREGAVLSVHAQPGASRTAIRGLYGESLKVAVQAPPVDGAANEALREFLCAVFGLPAARISLKTGSTGRKKTFVLQGLSVREVAKILEGKLP